MKELTLQEEIELVKSVRKFIANGSSRAVFAHPFDKNLAIKIAIGIGGINQNKREIRVNREIPDYTNTIHAYGKYTIVCDFIAQDLMNKVDRVVYNYVKEEEKKKIFYKEERKRVLEIVRKLTEINGDSSDNHQIGITRNGKIVAYDYGYAW